MDACSTIGWAANAVYGQIHAGLVKVDITQQTFERGIDFNYGFGYMP
jgi:hypothetical protein